ncbi:hypothetical protein BDW60DRAFT_71446 [Aspergillus nidulans var. acristatus]
MSMMHDLRASSGRLSHYYDLRRHDMNTARGRYDTYWDICIAMVFYFFVPYISYFGP